MISTTWRWVGLLFCWAGWAGAAQAQPVATPLGDRVLLRARADYSEFSCRFLSPEPSGDPWNDTVWGYFLLPHSEEPVPGIVLLHSLGNPNLSNELKLGRAIARKGVAVIIMTLPYHLERLPPGQRNQQLVTPGLDALRLALRQAISDTRAALSWLQQQPEIDAGRLGIVGISLGAVIGGAVLGVDQRTQAGVLLLGGGDVGELVWHSFLLRSLRSTARKLGLSAQTIGREWADVDPAALADPGRDVALLMLNARYDWVIPRSSADALWEAWERPPRLWLNGGHYGVALSRSRLADISADYLHWALVQGRQGKPPLPSNPIGWAPKIQFAWLEDKGLRLGVGLELKTLDSDGDWAWEAGLTWDQLYTGITVNLLGTGGSRYADLGIGYGIDWHGRTGLVVMAGFHF